MDDDQSFRHKLCLNYAIDELPCREKECKEIEDYVSNNLISQSSGTLYISGMPGTGKTASVMRTMSLLKTRAPKTSKKSTKSVKFSCIYVNGMQIGDVSQLFVEILKQLFKNENSKRKAATTVSANAAFIKLKSHFSRNVLESQVDAGNRTPIVVIIDELDVLITKKQRLLYNVFDWATLDKAQLTIIAIANTLDLPERALSSRITSRMGLKRICFEPYNHQQIVSILENRLKDCPVVNKEVLEFIARKVSALSGDLRRALEICRLSYDIYRQKCKIEQKEDVINVGKKTSRLSRKTAEIMVDKLNTITSPKWTIRDAEQAIKQFNSSIEVTAIRSLSMHEKLLMESVLQEYARTGQETIVERVLENYNGLCHRDGVSALKYDQFTAMLLKLAETKLLLIEYGREYHTRKLRLGISGDDLRYILNEMDSEENL